MPPLLSPSYSGSSGFPSRSGWRGEDWGGVDPRASQLSPKPSKVRGPPLLGAYSLPQGLPAGAKCTTGLCSLDFRGGKGVSVCPPKGGMGRGSQEGLSRRGDLGGGSQRGEGVWEMGGVELGRRAGKGASGRPGRRWRGRPHTRHCLDAAIIVSSEHPGSAGSAERELNKEPGEEESGEKSARGAGSSPVGLFLCPAPLLCAPPRRKHSSEMPDRDAAPPGHRGPAQGHCTVLGRERTASWRRRHCALVCLFGGQGQWEQNS